MKNMHDSEKSEREYLQNKFPEFSTEDLNRLYDIQPFSDYFTLYRVKTLIYWKECIEEKRAVDSGVLHTGG